MDERSEGLILRTRPLTDTSLVVEWLTPELGRLATVAKGARRPKSSFSGKLDFFYQATFSFQRSRQSDLHALREVQTLSSNERLRTDYALLHQAAYFAVLVEQGTERETPLPEIYELLRGYLEHLPSKEQMPEAMFLFEFRFLETLGMEPQIRHALFHQDFGSIRVIPREERNELNRALRIAVGTALERLPVQRQKAIQVLLAS